MKPPILVFVTCELALATASANAITKPAPHHLQPNAPRSVTVSEADIPPVVRAGLLQSTLILLPAVEKIATVFGGDTVDWVFDGGHIASRFISIKPKLANATMDIHIISGHGNEYTLQLQEISSDADVHFDSKVFIVPGDKAAKDRLNELPVFVPASELDKTKQEAQTAKAAQVAELKTEETKAETYRSQYPGSLHFDFTWNRKKGDELGLQQIWREKVTPVPLFATLSGRERAGLSGAVESGGRRRRRRGRRSAFGSFFRRFSPAVGSDALESGFLPKGEGPSVGVQVTYNKGF